MKTISHLKVLDGYRVWLRFDDGVEGDGDFSPHVGRGVFAAWNDYAVFQRAGIADHGRALEWPGEIDFCADALWLGVTRKQPEDLFPAQSTSKNMKHGEPGAAQPQPKEMAQTF